MGRDRDAGAKEFFKVRLIKVRNAYAGDFTGAPNPVELERRLDIPGHPEIPPVKLHHVEALYAEPLQRSVDDPLDVSTI